MYNNRNRNLLEQKADGTVALKDLSSGATGSYLYFWKADNSKLHFDRNSSADANCQLELWKKAGKASEESELPGYEKSDRDCSDYKRWAVSDCSESETTEAIM